MTNCTGESENLAIGSAVHESVWLARVITFAKILSGHPEIFIIVDDHGSTLMAKNDISGIIPSASTSEIIFPNTSTKKIAKDRVGGDNQYSRRYTNKTFRNV